MAVTIGNKVLLNPAEKANKYCAELHYGVARTNDGKFKLDDKNKAIHLTEKQRAWRAGYLTARSDNAKCFNAKKKK